MVCLFSFCLFESSPWKCTNWWLLLVFLTCSFESPSVFYFLIVILNSLCLFSFLFVFKGHLESVPAGGELLPVVDPEHPLLPVQPFSGGQCSVRNQIVRYNLFKMWEITLGNQIVRNNLLKNVRNNFMKMWEISISIKFSRGRCYVKNMFIALWEIQYQIVKKYVFQTTNAILQHEANAFQWCIYELFLLHFQNVLLQYVLGWWSMECKKISPERELGSIWWKVKAASN